MNNKIMAGNCIPIMSDVFAEEARVYKAQLNAKLDPKGPYYDVHIGEHWFTVPMRDTDLFKVPRKIIHNPPATIVIWMDDTKTVVKAHNEAYDAEKGVAMAYLKRWLGQTAYKHLLKAAVKDVPEPAHDKLLS